MNTYLTKDEQNSRRDLLTWSLELCGEDREELAIINSFNDRRSHQHLLHPFIYEVLGRQIQRIQQENDLHDFTERTAWNRGSGNGMVKFDIWFNRIGKAKSNRQVVANL